MEDRGCERLEPPVLGGCSNEGPVPKTDGFTSKGNIQICHGWALAGPLTPLKHGTNEVLVYLGVQNGFRIQVFVEDKNITTNENMKLGLMLENGQFYVGQNTQTSVQLKSALERRLSRTNATVLFRSSQSSDNPNPEQRMHPDSSNIHLPRRRQSILKNSSSIASTMFVVEVSRVNLSETVYTLNSAAVGNEVTLGIPRMHKYLHGAVQSIMFPTGKNRGISTLRSNRIRNLDEETTPIAFYNRPWIGVVPSMIICAGLILIWIVLATLGLESGVDARWAWKEFFSDTYTVSDFGKEVMKQKN
eukprot:gb/GEZJ01006500.1/.p1 GENE.gb/GEZJ01006500.1/~~gb/GEZJ01006500.1/.p1  ORF type:complete len:303 (+),score=28.07 gb/GEZJ01006500.1/:628-1536(+)